MNKTAKFLITTADERSWRKDSSVLCLGAWCRTHKRADAWNELNAEIASYHWDDRQKLYHDYLNLRDLHEVLLVELADKLNVFHGTQYSYRYWRILVGPWLLYFTQMLFDRWSMIRYAEEHYKISGTVVLDFPSEQILPNDMEDFRDMYSKDIWNHYLYGRILSEWSAIDCEKVRCDDLGTNSVVKRPFGLRQLISSFKGYILRGVSRLSQMLGRVTDVFFISTALPLKQDLLLQLVLGQLPKLNFQLPSPKVAQDFSIRKSFSLKADQYKDFEHCLRTLIPEQIPIVYLEGYSSLQNVVKNLPWPMKPKAIFTSFSYNADDVFKAWAGLRVEDGAPLLIGQHGGNLGSALWTSSEDHEISISDRYLTWGWSDGNSKQYPVAALKQIGKADGVWNRKGSLLLVTSVMPRYSYVMGSFTVSVTQTESSLDEQYAFVRALPKDVFEKLVIRLFMPDWGWSQSDRWREQFPDAHIDSGSAPIEPLVIESRLYIATYNATTFLDSLSRNIPTIMFWNEKHWELRPSAEPYFDKLKHVGIFHSCPESAAAKVSEIWDKVHEWWNQPEVQEARESFCYRYARTPQNPIKELKLAITTVKK